MSADTNVSAFFAKLNENPDLRAKVAEIMQTSAKKTAEAFAGLSRETQTPFTAEEFLLSTARGGEEASSGQEISDEALAGASGGIFGLENVFTLENFAKTFGHFSFNPGRNLGKGGLLTNDLRPND